jgi:translation initiation factor 2B subunit (eIF-2B alpha/beta/delta family)
MPAVLPEHIVTATLAAAERAMISRRVFSGLGCNKALELLTIIKLSRKQEQVVSEFIFKMRSLASDLCCHNICHVALKNMCLVLNGLSHSDAAFTNGE